MALDWEQIAERLAELAGTVDDTMRPNVELLQRAMSARAYDVDAMNVLLVQLESRLAPPGQAPVTFDFGNFSTEQQINIGNAVFNTVPKAPDEPQPVVAPVVVVAMDRGEAEALVAGSAFDSLPDQLREHFDQFQQLLVDEGLDDWLDRYGDAATDWRPFAAAGPTVDELVRATFEVVNTIERYAPAIEPDILDIRSVVDDRLRLRRLRRQCLVIIDSLSMRHPQVQARFHRSLLDAYPTTAVVAIAPVPAAFVAGRELSVYVPAMRLADLEYARRQADPDEDYGTCSETADSNQFEQWLRSRIRTMSVDLDVRSGIVRHMRVGRQ
ncbi:hypothetical protein [Solirubrobacter soli]|uniref:hypothetical protein n=1 Tax=Solirubrobacter soli TaxID=363832 RepID=UPI000416ED96|nr:hypothetical protein [Solirubrobacter soli]